MAEKILVAVAWPYANGPLHTGQIVSSQLPADILARYHRARGDLEALAASHDVPLTYLGAVSSDRLRLGRHIDLPVSELNRAYEEGLPRALEG